MCYNFLSLWYAVDVVALLRLATHFHVVVADYVKENFKHLPTIEVSSVEIIDLSREPPDVDELSRLMGSVSSLYPTKKQGTHSTYSMSACYV